MRTHVINSAQSCRKNVLTRLFSGVEGSIIHSRQQVRQPNRIGCLQAVGYQFSGENSNTQAMWTKLEDTVLRDLAIQRQNPHFN